MPRCCRRSFRLAFSLSGKASHQLPVLAFITCFALLPCGLVAQQTISVPATPAAVSNGTARYIAHYDPTKMLRLVIALQPPHMEEEEQFLRELQDPGSPQFHQYLSQQEWDRRFAPSVADEQAVAAWAQARGLTITYRFPNRLLVDVEAPAGVIEKALNVTINTYDIAGRTCYSNDRDPTLPARFAGVVSTVLGLNDVERAHRLSSGRQIMDEPRAPDYSPGPAYAVGRSLRGDGDHSKLDEAMAKAANGRGPFDQANPYGPADLYASTAYDYAALQNLGHCCNPLGNPGQSPPESSIAIAIWYDFSNDDFNGFLASYPYLAHNVQVYHVDGTPQMGSGETTLDVEWTTAMANSFHSSSDTAQVNVYEGVEGTYSVLLDVLNHILSDGHARVLSISWGGAEIYNASRSLIDEYHGVFDALAGQGWTIVAGSGDGGATSDCAHISALFPSSDPNITSAGGTSLSTSGNGYQGEIAWSGGPYGCATNDGGGGGGCSVVFSALPYAGSTACGSGSRSLPDIALNADPIYTPDAFFFQGRLQPTGGTSIAGPQLAGFYAQENAYLLYLQHIVGNTCGSGLNAPCAPLGDAKPALYYEGLNQPFAAHYPFYDITQGCNGNDITQQNGLTPFCAGPGFDQVTGWGSANMLQLAWTINTYVAGDFGAPTISVTGPPTGVWFNSDQLVSFQIADSSANGHRPIGVAGYSALWDADPGDDYAEATPGSGNSYYSGPMVANSSNGALHLTAAGLGCHTANVRAWDNAGQPSPDQTYGPVCFDNVPPITSVSLSGMMYMHYYQPQVQVTLTASDDLSGLAATYYQIDSNPVQTYTAPFLYSQPGPHTLGYYSVDVAGNVEPTQYVSFVVLSTQRATLTIAKTGSGTGTVISADGDINCGSTCSYAYFIGWPASLQPAPDPGSVFAGWSGCDSTSGYACNVAVLSSRTATVTFNQAVPLQFVSVNPCRVVDTRGPNGDFGGPALQGGTSRSFTIPQGPCAGIPANAAAYALNVTVVPVGHHSLNYLTVWPTGQPQPVVSTLNSYDGRTKASAAIVPSGTNAAVSVFATDTTDLILDISGYFVSPNPPATLAYFVLANPCRAVDTRGPQGPLGGPYLSAGIQRDFPVLSSSCQIPASAQAYAFNATAVPHHRLGYLTLWPSGQMQPVVSTLNAPTGTVVANAAIVNPGQNGAVSAYVTDDSDLILDINGYFAPATSGTNPLNLYALIPCRALDTRGTTGAFSGTIVTSLTSSPCALTTSAQAYVLTATVVPQPRLGYLTLWPAGEGQPLVSNLNAYDGAVTSNLAIVQEGPLFPGEIDAYASDPTNLILDISSYFGP